MSTHQYIQEPHISLFIPHCILLKDGIFGTNTEIHYSFSCLFHILHYASNVECEMNMEMHVLPILLTHADFIEDMHELLVGLLVMLIACQGVGHFRVNPRFHPTLVG